MDRFMAYLRIPSAYASGLRRLRWSATGDAIQFHEGDTFAFPSEVIPFLEGFMSQRSLIHFAHIIHLLYMLKKGDTPFLRRPNDVLARAFDTARRPYRNAGVFCAVVCQDIPSVPEPHLIFSTETIHLEVGASEPFFTLQEGEMPPLPPVVFEARILRVLSSYSFEEILHWFRHGRGPVSEAGEEIAQAVLLDKPRSLQGILADLAQRRRVSGAVPFVEQLVSALTLPPRRLEQSELPLGGYGDVATRGQVEQLLPSQFAFDDLEFVRRHAERELLYFRREDPHVHTREDLVVLLDQGIRTWGTARLVLTAALFALGRLAERRGLPFLVSATSGAGELLDPLQAAPGEFQELIEASDLSAHPGAALERVLTVETDAARDIILLTHPRNLVEPDVIAAARRLPANARLFAVAVEEHGEVAFSAIRHGAPVRLSRFHVETQRTAPPPAKKRADPWTNWRGDVEPVPYPFRFGLADDQKPIHLAFNAAGDWLLVATHGGMLHATRTNGSRSEILPRGLVRGTIIADLVQILGVASGFVVMSVTTNRESPYRIALTHYDLAARTCTAHCFTRFTPSPPPHAYYLRKLDTVVIQQGNVLSCIHLRTGDRKLIPAATVSPTPSEYREWLIDPLPVQGEGGPDAPEARWNWPTIGFNADSGTIHLLHTVSNWGKFTPLEDNKPVLKGCKLVSADCQGHTLAAFFTNPHNPGAPAMLRLFRGPQGIPLAACVHSHTSHRFVLSNDGRLLALQVGRGRVQIRDVLESRTIRHVLSVGRFHTQGQTHIQLGNCWLLIHSYQQAHLVLWNVRNLVFVRGKVEGGQLLLKDKFNSPLPPGVSAVRGRLPEYLKPDTGHRFVAAAWNNLIAVVDRYGQVALFERTGELVCMFFAFREQIAVWMPDGTCYGPMSLLGRPATPYALEKIGAALRAAWERGEGTVV